VIGFSFLGHKTD